MDGGDKKIWLVINFKANKNLKETINWIDAIGPNLPKSGNLKIVVCPSFSALSEIKKAILVGNYPIILGSQDLSEFGNGAYTGEEPGKFLTDFIELSIIGHSERRTNFGETDEVVAKKVSQAFDNNIISLVCVEDSQMPVPANCKLVAYEPIFAIGSGTPDTPENADNIAFKIKNINGQDTEVLYGGSVTKENIKAFIQRENISGCLVGTGAMDPDEFLKMVEICKI